MSDRAKGMILGAAMVYLIVACGYASTAMRMPAMNAIGGVYVGLTWPGAMFCVASGIDCDVIPPLYISRHFFTFPEV